MIGASGKQLLGDGEKPVRGVNLDAGSMVAAAVAGNAAFGAPLVGCHVEDFEKPAHVLARQVEKCL